MSEKIKGHAYHLTMEGLRKFINENEHLPDDTVVMIQRVHDVYFDTPDNGWETHKVVCPIEGQKEYFQPWCIGKLQKEEVVVIDASY
jgi:uncharacterized protein (UPF0335 family)